MIPSTLVGVLLAVAAVSPGYIYVRVASSRRPRAERTALTETAEYLIWGIVTIGLAAVTIFGLAEIDGSPFAPIGGLAAAGSSVFAEDPWSVIWTVAAIYALALVISLAASLVIERGSSGSHVQEPVWWTVFGKRSGGDELFCSVWLPGGRIVEGFLYSYTTDSSGPRDVALKAPLWFWEGGTRYSAPGVDRVVLPADQISEIDARFVSRSS